MRLLLLWVALCPLLAQRKSETDFQQSFAKILEQIRGGRLDAAEALTRSLLPSPKAEPGLPPTYIQRGKSRYGIAWGRLIFACLRSGDYARAQRLLLDRVRATEAEFGGDHFGITIFLEILGAAYVLDGKPDEALTAYRRCLELRAPKGLADAIVSDETYAGMVEALLMKNRPGEAAAMGWPGIRGAGGMLGEAGRNALAVALRELGRNAEAEQLERDLDAQSTSLPGTHAQTRDLLRARLYAFRHASAEADAIYARWIAHWESWIQSKDRGAANWDQVLIVPLGEYARFLHRQRRHPEAEAVDSRLREIAEKHKWAFNPLLAK